jgi:hypothetical protein
MKIMKEVKIEDKEKYLKDHFPFEPVPEVYDKKKCIHCDSVFYVGDFKVFADELGEEYICCPNAPECDGTVIDWIRVEEN